MTEQLANGKPAAGVEDGRADRGGDVLVVGDRLRVDRVRQMLRQAGCSGPIRSVSGYLMAMGMVRGAVPGVLIGSVEDLDEPMEPTIAALRHLAPSMRLVFTSPQHRRADVSRCVAAGGDVCLVDPIEPRALARAVFAQEGWERTTGYPAGQTPGRQPPRAPEPIAWPSDTDPAASVVVERIESGVPTGSGQTPGDLDSGRASESELGDVDLVEHLLHRRAGFADLVIRLITQRSGLASVRWVPGAGAGRIATGGVCVPVVYRGQTLGRLSAEGATSPDQLEPWAAWIAKWLALHEQMGQLWGMSLRDELTGAWNRRYFDRFLKNILERAAEARFHVTLLVFDIDDFKRYNDRYGHAAGDQILRETTRLMQSVVREQDVVARIGGDEFAVIFWDQDEPRRPPSEHPQDVREAAGRFQRAICEHRFPKLGDQAHGTLTISGGLAGFPWDGRTPQDLLELADRMAIRSKQQGKNAITFGPGAGKVCQQENPA